MINEISPNLLSKNAEKNLFVWNFTLPLHSQSKKGSLAQLVQSICLTSRGSAVRIRQLPLSNKSHSVLSGFLFEWELPSHLFLHSLPMPLPLTKGGVFISYNASKQKPLSFEWLFVWAGVTLPSNFIFPPHAPPFYKGRGFISYNASKQKPLSFEWYFYLSGNYPSFYL